MIKNRAKIQLETENAIATVALLPKPAIVHD